MKVRKLSRWQCLQRKVAKQRWGPVPGAPGGARCGSGLCLARSAGPALAGPLTAEGTPGRCYCSWPGPGSTWERRGANSATCHRRVGQEKGQAMAAPGLGESLCGPHRLTGRSPTSSQISTSDILFPRDIYLELRYRFLCLKYCLRRKHVKHTTFP